MVIIITIYFLMMYTEFSVMDDRTRDSLGVPMICLTISNFVINLLPILYDVCYKVKLRCIRRRNSERANAARYERDIKRLEKFT